MGMFRRLEARGDPPMLLECGANFGSRPPSEQRAEQEDNDFARLIRDHSIVPPGTPPQGFTPRDPEAADRAATEILLKLGSEKQKALVGIAEALGGLIEEGGPQTKARRKTRRDRLREQEAERMKTAKGLNRSYEEMKELIPLTPCEDDELHVI